MLDAIRALFAGEPTTAAAEPETKPETHVTFYADPLHIAACALLLDVAYADGEFSEAEVEHLEAVLARHFGLSEEDGRRILALADEARRRSVDHYQFTSVLLRGYDVGQKMVLAEVMWGLALADGEIAEHEHYLTRKIANLLDLEPAYLSSAKSAAARRQAERKSE